MLIILAFSAQLQDILTSSLILSDFLIFPRDAQNIFRGFVAG